MAGVPVTLQVLGGFLTGLLLGPVWGGAAMALYLLAGAIGGLNRAFSRSETFALALRARCFARNPTLPALSFTRLDVPVLGLAAALGLAAGL